MKTQSFASVGAAVVAAPSPAPLSVEEARASLRNSGRGRYAVIVTTKGV